MPMALSTTETYSVRAPASRASSQKASRSCRSGPTSEARATTTKARATWAPMGAISRRRKTKKMLMATAAATTAAIPFTAPPPSLPELEDGLHVVKKGGDHPDQPHQDDDHAGEAQHLRLLTPAGLREKDVEDGDDDPKAGDLVDHGDVHQGPSFGVVAAGAGAPAPRAPPSTAAGPGSGRRTRPGPCRGGPLPAAAAGRRPASPPAGSWPSGGAGPDRPPPTGRGPEPGGPTARGRSPGEPTAPPTPKKTPSEPGRRAIPPPAAPPPGDTPSRRRAAPRPPAAARRPAAPARRPRGFPEAPGR